MHRAGPIVVDRKTGDRRTLFVERAPVSITGGIQPGVFAQALNPEFLDSGLIARLLMAMPPKLPKRWTEARVEPDVDNAYRSILDKLYALQFDYQDGEAAPHVLRLSKEAEVAWIDFYNAWALEQAAVEGEVAAAYSKLEGAAARFALVHHVVTLQWLDVDDCREIGVKSVEAGVTLCRWFAQEALRIYATLSESAEERSLRRLFEFIQARGGRMSVRQLMRANCRRYRTTEDAEAGLASLVEAGLARWVEAESTMKGGIPIREIILCMTHDTDDTGPEDMPDSPAETHDSTPQSCSSPSAGSQAENDATPYPPSASGENSQPTEESGVIGVMRHAQSENVNAAVEPTARCHASEAQAASGVMRSTSHPIPPPEFLVVADETSLNSVITALNDVGKVAADLECTGLDPHVDRVRLLSPGPAGRRRLVVDSPTGRVRGERRRPLYDCDANDAFGRRL